MAWKALDWRGKVNLLRWNKCKVPLEEKALGTTVFDMYPEGRTHCAACGNILWHYWEAENGAGQVYDIGHACAQIILGVPPAQWFKQERERRAYEAELERARADRVERSNWWKAPAQAELRRLLVAGARQD